MLVAPTGERLMERSSHCAARRSKARSARLGCWAAAGLAKTGTSIEEPSAKTTRRRFVFMASRASEREEGQGSSLPRRSAGATYSRAQFPQYGPKCCKCVAELTSKRGRFYPRRSSERQILPLQSPKAQPTCAAD